MTSTDIVRTGGALAIRADQTEWTPAQSAVLQQSGISNQVTSAELSGFLHLCQRTQLDPFSRQIYLIGRFDKRADREVFTPQTGIDGYRVVAHRVVAASGEHFCYEDTQWCDASGRWRDVWLSTEPPAAARVTVLRNGQRFPAIAVFREYVQTNRDGKPVGLWTKMPAGQVAKCAEALALRKAFPHDLAGVYTAEEMAQAENPAPVAEQPVRQLRQVQPGESDPWQTPEATAPEVNAVAQAVADKGAMAVHRGEARPLWPLAKTGHVLEAPVLAPDTGALDQLGSYLTRRLKELPDAPVEAEDNIPDVEVVPDDPETVREHAIKALRFAAGQAGLQDADLEEGFEAAFGTPVDAGTLANLQKMTLTLCQSVSAA